MTDRAHSLTVVLAKDARTDDLEQLMSAIRMFRGVIDVSANVADLASHSAQMRARSELGQKLLDVIYPPNT